MPVSCRLCAAPLEVVVVDLGSAPPANRLLRPEALAAPEAWYPLRVLVCESCWLVQTDEVALAEEPFSEDYAYHSSHSSTWLAHAERYVGAMIARFGLGAGHRVVEVAANDGYLLRFVKARGLPCYGVEPADGAASKARALGIEMVSAFFGRAEARRLAAAGRRADLLVANNVLAHVPDLDDFAAGLGILLEPEGVLTLEFPHLPRLLEGDQFDTIYHEHRSYLSLAVVVRVLAAHGLSVFDVETLPTHGGSLRVYAAHGGRRGGPSERVDAVLRDEERAGLRRREGYQGFQERADRLRHGVLRFLLDMRRDGRKVGAYGAAAKGATLLNFAGVRPDLLPWVVDRSPLKQGRFLPGSRIPIVDESWIARERPDYVLVLPWNLREEIAGQLAGVRTWGGRFVTAVPGVRIWE